MQLLRVNELISQVKNEDPNLVNDDDNKSLMVDILDNLKIKYSLSEEEIAIAAINLAIGKKPFFTNEDESWMHKQNNSERERFSRNSNNRSRSSNRRSNYQNSGFETFKFNFGKSNKIRVANIISSICNATNINGRTIGKIQIFNDFSFIFNY